MTHSDPRAARLASALPDGPPPGRIVAFGPRAGEDIGGLGAGAEVITGFFPDAAAFAARGHVTRLAPEGRYALSLVCLPRARAAARDLVAQALAVTDGPVLVDGQKTDGVEALLRAARALVAVPAPVAQAHGKLFRLEGAERAAFAEWRAGPQRLACGFVTRPGVFSADGPDPGSVCLDAALPAHLPPLVAELGAGWGWLAARLLARPGLEALHLVEADHAALDCARENLADPRVSFHWADATQFAPERPFDAVVMNPPFHRGRTGDPALGTGFIAAAGRMLAPHGVLWLVANRHLPYEAALAAAFREVEERPASPAYKVFRAARPLPARAPAVAPPRRSVRHAGRRRS
jgi:16S rRNA (guanine1207-N2)-methyltransferase